MDKLIACFIALFTLAILAPERPKDKSDLRLVEWWSTCALTALLTTFYVLVCWISENI